MANIISKSAQCQLSDNLFRTIYARIRVNSAAVAASITATPLFNKDVIPYVFTGVQPTPADAGANIPTLANGLNSTIGIVAYTQDAEQLVGVQLFPLTVADSGLGGTLTAGPVVLADLGGAGATGVSASKNLCFRMTLTGLTLDAGIGVHDFNIAITYKLNLQV